jgi:hypothetical protein
VSTRQAKGKLIIIINNNSNNNNNNNNNNNIEAKLGAGLA